ncbi:TIGR03667 family PPOX class F420-dependent oxidoreductase [Nocardia thailandica]
MSLIDPSTDFGARATRRLDTEQVIWLTTTGRSGTPQPNPVWFRWHDGEFLVFTQPGTPKLANIAAQPKVSLNLNSTPSGGDVVVLTGIARVDETPVPTAELDAFVAKYTDGLAELGMSREKFFADYAVVLRITPERVRGF